jgi:plastocyanin
MRRTRLAVVSVTVLVFFGIMVATAASDHGNRVDIKDDCDATFNADPPTGPGLGPGTCVRGGSTTFAGFVAQLSAQGHADGWEFNPSKMTIESDETLSTRNKGGEFHTFTEVQQFGGGCIPFINGLLHLTPVAECQPEVAPGVPLAFVTTGVPAGGGSTVGALATGTHRFQCLIHPWMRTTVVVRQAD